MKLMCFSGNQVIRKLDSATQTVSVYAGQMGVYTPYSNGAYNVATFYNPTDLAIDPSGQIYVADYVRLIPTYVWFWPDSF